MRGEALAAAAAWAVGAWCASGAVASETAAATARIGALAPWWLLVLLLSGAWSLAWLGRLTRQSAAPLWLPLLSMLPWLPVPLPPAALLAVGPLGQMLAAACLVATTIAALMERLGFGVDPVRPATPIVALALVFSASAWCVSPRVPGGDEPHYLIITQSLLADGDLRIENNHARREYAAYVDGELKPDYLRRGRDGAIYSIHAPGLAALVLPGFLLAGYPGAVLTVALLAAIGVAASWQAAREVSGSVMAAGVAAAGVGLSVPFFFQAFTIYPDGPAAVAVAVVVWLALARRAPPTWRGALACGVLLGALPWLHTRYGAIAGPLGLIVAGRLLWPREGSIDRTAHLGALGALAIPALLSAAAWLAMFQAIYGIWDPRAPYGHATDMRLARIPHGLAGLLLDQQFGLLPNAPIYLAAVAGLVPLWRRDRRLATELLAAIVPYVTAVAGFHMWWGGRSSPVRFLVPVLLPMAIPLASWWASQTTRTARAVTLVLVCASLGLTAAFVLVDRGALIYNSRDGHALWLLAASPSVNLTLALPSLFQAGPTTAVLLFAAWAAAGALAWIGLRRLERRELRTGPWLAAVLGGSIAVVVVGASLGWARAPDMAWDAGNGLMSVAARSCDADALGVGTTPPRIGSVAHLLAGLPLADASRRPPRGDVPRWAGSGLPPGRYRVIVSSGLNVTGAVTIALGRPDRRLMVCTFAEQAPGTTACEVSLPAGASALWMTGDSALARTVDSLALTMTEPGAPSRCGLRAQRAVATPGAAFFVVTGRAWTEEDGLWTAGGGTVGVVAESSTHVLSMRIRQGGVAGAVRVQSGAWHQERTLPPGEVWDVDVPRRSTDRVVEFDIATDRGSRPADHDPASADMRLLGAWVQPR